VGAGGECDFGPNTDGGGFLSPAAAFAGVAVLLAFAGAWELAGSRGEELGAAARRALAGLSGGRARSLAEAALRLGIPMRLTRAGLEGRVPVSAVLAAKAGGAGRGAALAAIAAPAAPGRLSLLVAVAFPVAGFLVPEGTTGPLARELAVAAVEIECGSSQRAALDGLRDRMPGGEVAALAAALDRSSRYGSPLADQLRKQATSLRRDHRRRIEEQAARAAPKIQLVVALVLVPSVLLMIAAALIANADVLLGGL
jgi:tight adherence protein C